MSQDILRLHQAISAVSPIMGLSVGTWGDVNTVRIDYDSSATNTQKTNAQSTLQSFDWSQSAEDSWLLTQQRTQAVSDLSSANQKLIRALMLAVLDEINTLRTAAGLSARTATQVRTAIINKINSGAAD